MLGYFLVSIFEPHLISPRQRNQFDSGIKNLEKNKNLLLESEIDMIFNYATNSLCEEWLKFEKEKDQECFFKTDKESGCEVILAFFFHLLGSIKIENGKIKKLKFGEGYYSKVIYLDYEEKEYVSTNPKFSFKDHFVILLPTDTGEEYVFDMAYSDKKPLLKKDFLKRYQEFKVANTCLNYHELSLKKTLKIFNTRIPSNSDDIIRGLINKALGTIYIMKTLNYYISYFKHKK